MVKVHGLDVFDVDTVSGKVIQKVEHPQTRWRGVRVAASDYAGAVQVWNEWARLIHVQSEYQSREFDAGRPVSSAEYARRFPETRVTEAAGSAILMLEGGKLVSV
jgi:hypothetical protein